MWEDLFTAITNPDSIAHNVYSAFIIDNEVRDKILEHRLTSDKKQVLLTAVEAKIKLEPNVYYQFLDILSKDPSKKRICQKMREKCGKSQLCITSTEV